MNKYNIGKRIASCREKNGLSTQDLADRIGRSQATISRIENGKQGLTFELLSEIAGILRVHPFALLSDEPLNSFLVPASDGKQIRANGPNLLANALRGGRIRRNLTLEDVSRLLDLPLVQLESHERGLSCPAEPYLEKMCQLYGLNHDEIKEVKRFGEAVPEIAGGLAYLQRLFAHLRNMVHAVQEGEENRVLKKITRLLDSIENDYSPPSEWLGDDAGQVFNRLVGEVVRVLQDNGNGALARERLPVRSESGNGDGDAMDEI